MTTYPRQTWDQSGNLVSSDTVEIDDTAEVSERMINDRLDTSLAAMSAHVTRGTFTAAQRDNALLLVLRVCIGLVRLTRRRLDGTD